MLQFFVKDNGIGISPKDHKAIFDRFIQVDSDYSRSGSGTGLGLSIVKSLVNLLNGEVWVVSETDQGASFYFTIPYQPAKQTENNDNNTTENLKGIDGVSILIVEDEYSNYLYLEAILEDYHYKLIHTENGKEAVEIMQNLNDIDIVLMDIKMPVMNGYEATKEIRKTNKSIPIIALTAYAMETDRQKALKLGFNDYLSKPVERKVVLEIINKYIKQK